MQAKGEEQTETKTERSRGAFNEAYSKIKPLSWDDAQDVMIQNMGSLKAELGESGVRELWNSVFADAIRKGRRDLAYENIFAIE